MLPYIRTLSLADRVRWSCALEAIAPKLGNVHPSASFHDLSASDFLVAGDLLAKAIEADDSVGLQILNAVIAARQSLRSNANLGICLLIAPLVAAERLILTQGLTWQTAIERVLAELTEEDCRAVYAAIRAAHPGGLGEVSQADIHDSPPANLLDAMRLSERHDLIARQYATGFRDVFDTVVPAISEEIERSGDMLWGIRCAQVRILSLLPDSLIGRKCGAEIALQATRRAQDVLRCTDATARRDAEGRLDQWLREDGNRRNPGTTADLIAAGLFILLSPIKEV